MCVLEYILKKKKQGVHLLRDNEYILSFLEHVCKYSENNPVLHKLLCSTHLESVYCKLHNWWQFRSHDWWLSYIWWYTGSRSSHPENIHMVMVI